MRWMKDRVRELGKTGAAFGRVLDIPKERVYEMYRGARKLQQTEVGRAAKFLEMTEAELVARLEGSLPPESSAKPVDATVLGFEPNARSERVQNLDPEPQRQQPPVDKDRLPDIPVLGTALGGAGGDFFMNGGEHDFVRRPMELAGRKGIFALWVRGESMEPRYFSGELLYLDSIRPPKNGDFVVVELRPVGPHPEKPAYLKRLVLGSGGGKLKLQQYNPPRTFEIPREKVEKIYRVMPTEEVVGK